MLVGLLFCAAFVAFSFFAKLFSLSLLLGLLAGDVNGHVFFSRRMMVMVVAADTYTFCKLYEKIFMKKNMKAS